MEDIITSPQGLKRIHVYLEQDTNVDYSKRSHRRKECKWLKTLSQNDIDLISLRSFICRVDWRSIISNAIEIFDENNSVIANFLLLLHHRVYWSTSSNIIISILDTNPLNGIVLTIQQCILCKGITKLSSSYW
jgi:hypothetical protein